MNRAIGKFGQTQTNQELLCESVEKIEELKQQGYKPIKGVGIDYLYLKKPTNTTRS